MELEETVEETVEQDVVREAREETGQDVRLTVMLAVDLRTLAEQDAVDLVHVAHRAWQGQQELRRG